MRGEAKIHLRFFGVQQLFEKMTYSGVTEFDEVKSGGNDKNPLCLRGKSHSVEWSTPSAQSFESKFLGAKG